MQIGLLKGAHTIAVMQTNLIIKLLLAGLTSPYIHTTATLRSWQAKEKRLKEGRQCLLEITVPKWENRRHSKK